MPKTQRVSAVGLDVGEDACHLVLVSGDTTHPDRVYCAERLNVPDGMVKQGEVVQPEALGQWLRDFLDHGDYQAECLYVGLASALITHHAIALPQGLSDQDVAFQLQADVQALQSAHSGALCLDYRLAESDSSLGMKHYAVQAVALHAVEALQRVAHTASLALQSVEPRTEAQRRVAQCPTLKTLTPIGTALALQFNEAFGLALRAWYEDGINFLPYRAQRQSALRRGWIWRTAVCVLVGACVAAGFAFAVAFLTESKRQQMGDLEASARAWERTQKEHAQAQAQQQRDQAQAQWLQTRHALQAQSLQWNRLLGQSAPGVWVASVRQQGAHWVVQGEALSSEHAHELLGRLKALDIWAQVPALPDLQMAPSATALGLSVWRFRIEAHFKGGV